MGEMKFKQRGEQAEPDGTTEAEKVSFLLGVNSNDFIKSLVKPKIKVGTEVVAQSRTKDQVVNSISAMSKSLYDRVFNWLVKRVNHSLDTKNKRNYYIGVLDIAGFEIFDVSGFFCMLFILFLILIIYSKQQIIFDWNCLHENQHVILLALNQCNNIDNKGKNQTKIK